MRFTGTLPINIIASIALLSACPLVLLAAVLVTFSETVLDATRPKGLLKRTSLTPNSKPTAADFIVLSPGPTDKDGNLTLADDKNDNGIT